MQRQLMAELKCWKAKKKHLPLILRGARQVGKTWLMKEFGRSCYTHSLYINFDHNPRMKQLFSSDFDVSRLCEGLSLESGEKIIAGETLIILDEIQEVPRALQALKYFAEEAPELEIISAGSLLGMALHSGLSFPVGKVQTLDLYPLSFTEFLEAKGEDKLLEVLRNRDFEMAAIFKDRYIQSLKQYFIVGGMPAAVNAFLRDQDYHELRRLQKELIFNYEADFSKHVPVDQIARLNMVWNSIPSQLAKENKKFIYSVIKKGGRAREFETAIQWLIDCGLCLRVDRVNKGGLPLKAYQDLSAFKLYLHDIGLLCAMVDLDPRTILLGDELFSEFKGALAEQFVCQQVLADCQLTPYYWTNQQSSGEVDFVLQIGQHIVPLEVKSGENLEAKSLKAFATKYAPCIPVRTSLANYRKDGQLVNLPLYAISQIDKIVEQLSNE